MPTPTNPELRAHMEAVFEKLLLAGWIKEFFFHDTKGLSAPVG